MNEYIDQKMKEFDEKFPHGLDKKCEDGWVSCGEEVKFFLRSALEKQEKMYERNAEEDLELINTQKECINEQSLHHKKETIKARIEELELHNDCFNCASSVIERIAQLKEGLK